MKVHHHLARGFWDVDDHRDHQSPSLSLSCKRLRPLAPKLSDSSTTTTAAAAFDLKSFIRPDSGPRKLAPTATSSPSAPQVETQAGGTRWNPTQEQIGILEMLYSKGMRTPNAQQIDHITLHLSNYGKIEGKNVFYWFQNHKARERQKQKRTTTLTLLSPPPHHHHATPPPPSSSDATTSFLSSITLSFDNSPSSKELREDEQVPNKRKSRSWGFEGLVIGDGSKSESDDHEEEGAKKTLELFPLHPEGK